MNVEYEGYSFDRRQIEKIVVHLKPRVALAACCRCYEATRFYATHPSGSYISNEALRLNK